MNRTLRLLSSATLLTQLFLGSSLPALAVDELNVTRGLTAASAPLAVHGYDPVAFFTRGTPTEGTAAHSSVHDGATYYFASQESRKKFEKDPERYAPAYGGFCAFGVSVGKKFDGDPRYWRIEDERLYLNLNADIAKEFAKDVPGAIAKAEKSWQKIEHRAVEDL